MPPCSRSWFVGRSGLGPRPEANCVPPATYLFFATLTITSSKFASLQRALTIGHRADGPVGGREFALVASSADDEIGPGARRGPEGARLRDPGDPRRPGARPGHRGRGGADLPDVAVRPGRRRPGQGVVLLPHRKPDPGRPRALHRLAGGSGARVLLRERGGRRGRRPPAPPAR